MVILFLPNFFKVAIFIFRNSFILKIALYVINLLPICLHNQLKFLNSIELKLWKFIKETANGWLLLAKNVLGKMWVGSCVSTGKRFFVDTLFYSQGKTLSYSKKGNRDFLNRSPFKKSACFYVIITGEFVGFQYLKVVSAIFLVVCFVCLKESTFETRKNVFDLTSKALFVLEIIRF